jgi:hypothetical protein
VRGFRLSRLSSRDGRRRGGFVFRAGFTFILVDGVGPPWAGIGLGYAF